MTIIAGTGPFSDEAPFDFYADLLTHEVRTLALKAGRLGVWVWDLDQDCVAFDEAQGELTGLGAGNHDPDSFFSRIAEEDISAVNVSIETCLLKGAPCHAEFRFRRPDGEIIWLSCHGERRLDPATGHVIIYGVNHDISLIREQTERAELVSREMLHRVKNLISVVSAMYRMTARSAPDLATHQSAFMDRLAAIAECNTQLYYHGGGHAPAGKIVASALSGFAEDPRIRLGDCADVLTHQHAQTLAMIMTELTTNSLKYGGLSVDEGSVEISLTRSDDCRYVTLIWNELGIPQIPEPDTGGGFGSTVIGKYAEQAFKSPPVIEWADGQLTYRCRIPLDAAGAQNAPSDSPE